MYVHRVLFFSSDELDELELELVHLPLKRSVMGYLLLQTIVDLVLAFF